MLLSIPCLSFPFLILFLSIILYLFSVYLPFTLKLPIMLNQHRPIELVPNKHGFTIMMDVLTHVTMPASAWGLIILSHPELPSLDKCGGPHTLASPLLCKDISGQLCTRRADELFR